MRRNPDEDSMLYVVVWDMRMIMARTSARRVQW